MRIFIELFKTGWERSHFLGTFPSCFINSTYLYRPEIGSQQSNTVFMILKKVNYIIEQ